MQEISLKLLQLGEQKPRGREGGREREKEREKEKAKRVKSCDADFVI